MAFGSTCGAGDMHHCYPQRGRFDLEAQPDGCLLRMTETPIGSYKRASTILQPLIRARNAGSMHRLTNLVASHHAIPSELAPVPPQRRT